MQKALVSSLGLALVSSLGLALVSSQGLAALVSSLGLARASLTVHDFGHNFSSSTTAKIMHQICMISAC